jgi:hypothetical protein
MRKFRDHGKIADLRIPIDLTQNPRFSFNTRVTSYPGVRAVHLGHILDPSISVLR